MINYAETAYESIYYAEDLIQTDEDILHDSRFDIALMDKNDTIIFPLPNSFNVKFKKGFFTEGNHYFYIKTIELAEMKNIHYLVVRADTIDANLAKTRSILFLVLFFSILFFSVMIFILSKLFLRPMKQYIEILNKFIRDATHELNTPISVISMSLERMEKEDLSSKNIKSLEHIKVASKTLSHLYSDLSFTVHPTNTYPINKIEVDKLLLERIDFFVSLAQPKRITFINKIGPCNLMLNENVLSRIIDNLLSNAIKYNKRDGKIRVKLDQDSLVISDTGIGFDQEMADRIFERYKRLDTSSGGFGLGLSIVKSLCELYKIDIDVLSKKGVGTTFTLSWKNSQIVHTS